MSILITGTTGFIGSYVLRALVEETKEDIVLLKRTFSNIARISDLMNNNRILSYNIDETNLENIFKNNNIDTIIHLATEYGRKKNSELETLTTNLMFPIELIDTGKKYGLKNFINTDSYFNKEGVTYHYLLNYSLSKKSLILWLKYYSSQINIANVILEHPYGPFDSKTKFTEMVIRKIAIDNVSEINLTAGCQKRDFIYVKDVASAYLKILKFVRNSSRGYHNIEVGTGTSISIKEFVKKIKNISNSNTKLNFGKIPYREDEIMNSQAKNNILLSLGWKPDYGIDKGLSEIIELYKGEEND